MIILFCADPLNPRKPDPLYADEVTTARAAGFETALISFEALVDDGDAIAATQRAPAQDHQTLGVYRGWMIRPDTYAQLYAALLERRIQLINDPARYRHAHYLPENHAVIATLTPRTVWAPLIGEIDMDAIMRLLAPFGPAPLVLKDYVKSRKHEWNDACFIPDAADRVVVERVVRRFVALQGTDLNEGLVFREFVEFAPLATHSKSGMPLTREYRSFWLDGALLAIMPYWEEGEYAEAAPDLTAFSAIAQAVQSRFFTLDVAQLKSGAWQIVEVGDGQVAGLPDNTNIAAFYQSLHDILSHNGHAPHTS